MTRLLVDAELPAVYLDALAVETPAGRLHLVNRAPEPDETAVPLTSWVDLTLLDVGGTPGFLASSVRVFVGEGLAYDAAVGGFQAGWRGPSSAVTSPRPNARRLILHPEAPFPSLAHVSVRVLAQTADGAETLDQTYAFTCVDVTTPGVLGAQTVGHRSVRVAFDEAMRAGTADGGAEDPTKYTLARLSTPAVVPRVLAAARVSGTTVALTLDRDMTPGAAYAVTVLGAADLAGNAVAPPENAARFSGYACAVPRGRDFDLWSWMPLKNRRDDDEGTGDLRRFLACLQEVTDLLLCDVDAWGDILDPDLAPEPVLDRMLLDLGNPFSFDLTVDDKRRLLRVLVPLYKQKGTAPGITNAVRFFLGFEAAVTPYAGEGLVLGESLLGEEWVLAVGDARARYSFDVAVERALTNEERTRLRALVQSMKRVGTHFVNLIEPPIPLFPEHLELGVSELGDTWELH